MVPSIFQYWNGWSPNMTGSYENEYEYDEKYMPSGALVTLSTPSTRIVMLHTSVDAYAAGYPFEKTHAPIASHGPVVPKYAAASLYSEQKPW